jgi:hypothetical protein
MEQVLEKSTFKREAGFMITIGPTELRVVRSIELFVSISQLYWGEERLCLNERLMRDRYDIFEESRKALEEGNQVRARL